MNKQHMLICSQGQICQGLKLEFLTGLFFKREVYNDLGMISSVYSVIMDTSVALTMEAKNSIEVNSTEK